MTKIDQDRIDFAVKFLSWLETYMRHDCSGATAESLDSVMECGKDEVKQFVMENAGPKALKVIGNMLGKDDDDSEEDD